MHIHVHAANGRASCAPSFGLSCAASPRHRGPRLGGILPQKRQLALFSSALDLSRSERSYRRSAGMHGFVHQPAPFAVPSIAGDGEEGPKGRAQEARASAAVHGRTVSRPRRRREAQGSSIRTMRIEPPRWALDLFGYFLGQCQKVTGSPAGRDEALHFRGTRARNWIPACAGMTSKKAVKSEREISAHARLTPQEPRQCEPRRQRER